MKKLLSTMAFALALVTWASAHHVMNNPDDGITTKEIIESTIQWQGHKVTGSHNGTVALKSGSLEFDGDAPTGGNFVIDMTTIDCDDLSGNWKDKLVGHLKSDDFFGVETHPEAILAITSTLQISSTRTTSKPILPSKGRRIRSPLYRRSSMVRQRPASR